MALKDGFRAEKEEEEEEVPSNCARTTQTNHLLFMMPAAVDK